MKVKNQGRKWMWGMLALLASCSWSASAASVGGLVGQRLSMMKEVAAWKAANHKPVEDLPQEKRVLDSSLAEARKLGLSPDSVAPFIQAQMDVAKAIQYRYRADWLSEPNRPTPPRSLDETRSQLNSISSEILRQLSRDLRMDPQAGSKACSALQSLRLHQLTNNDKRYLCQTLRQVKRIRQ